MVAAREGAGGAGIGTDDGDNNLTFRVGDDKTTAITITVTYGAPTPAEVMFDPSDPSTLTWTKAIAKTTCGDWNNSMTPKQRFAMAALMLTAARKGQGLDDASDQLFMDFGNAISETCLPPAGILKVAEVAAAGLPRP